MTSDSQEICTGCGRSIIKVHRRYKTEPYCSSCYARLFKVSNCPKCDQQAKLPTFDKTAICRRCETNQPCARCHKEDYKMGKITEYGPVCNACSVYFRKEEDCEACGKPSKMLSRNRHLGHDLRVCPKCSRQSYGSCESCKRHRQLYEDKTGRKLCKKCLTQVSSVCKTCGHRMPAGRGKECEDCYWTRSLKKRTKTNCAGLTHQKLKDHFRSFSRWLLLKNGPNRAAIHIDKYYPFFREVDVTWGDFPDYKKLLYHFTPEGLRTYRRAMNWLSDLRLIFIDEKLKQNYGEQLQIKKLLASVPQKTLMQTVILKYYRTLKSKLDAEKISIRTTRLILSACIGLFNYIEKQNSNLPTQAELDSYMLVKPGQKANLTGFINFINRTYDGSLNLTVDKKKAAAAQRKQLEKQMLKLLANPDDSELFQRNWIKYGLGFYHNIPQRLASKISKHDFSLNADGSFTIPWENSEYWLPKPEDTN